MKPVYSEIIIFAPADLVWSVIADPDLYPEWNPFTPRISLKTKEQVVGTEFDLDCQMTEESLLRREKEVVLEVNPQERRFRMGTSRTRGRPGIQSNRCQTCSPTADDCTRYVNFEEFAGLLSPVVYLIYSSKLERAFGRHNRALKARAEALFAAQKNN